MKKTPAIYELTFGDVKEAIADWLFNHHSIGNSDADELNFVWKEDGSYKDNATMVTITEVEEE